MILFKHLQINFPGTSPNGLFESIPAAQKKKKVHLGQAKVHPDQYLVLGDSQQVQDEDKLTVIQLEDCRC